MFPAKKAYLQLQDLGLLGLKICGAFMRAPLYRQVKKLYKTERDKHAGWRRQTGNKGNDHKDGMSEIGRGRIRQGREREGKGREIKRQETTD